MMAIAANLSYKKYIIQFLLLGKIERNKKKEVEEESRIVVACNIDRQAFEFMLKRNIERCRKAQRSKGATNYYTWNIMISKQQSYKNMN